ncbi:MAG TPA: endonuclease/exonuclease/phosphatase family protein [Sedimentisphaerales bacterium]|nr:endonuclease/exonuclease/phosphatase family protein [Sedimentisphaerales bacterium]
MYRKITSTITKSLFAFAVVLGLLVLFSPCAKAADSGPAGASGLEVRIMTFNIRYGSANDGENQWKNRRDMVFDVIRKQKSDVIGLQEALRFQIDEIRQALPMYAEIGVAREDGKIDGEYSAILYRADRFGVGEAGTFWLSDTPEVPGSNTWGNACVRICTWARLVENSSGKAFYAFNLHLDHVSQPSREKSAVLLTQRIGSRKLAEPFVLTGDFNTGETNPVIAYLKGQTALAGADGVSAKNPIPLADTFRVLHPDVEDVRTGHAFKGSRQGNKIDYVFVPPGMKVLEAEILYDNVEGRYPSDHFPVVARLVLPAAGER